MNRGKNIDCNIKIDKFDFKEKVEYVTYAWSIFVSGILIRVYEIDIFTGNLLIVGGSLFGFLTLFILMPSSEKTRIELEEKERRILSYLRL